MQITFSREVLEYRSDEGGLGIDLLARHRKALR